MHISCTYSGSVQDLKYCYRHFQYFIPDNGPCNEIEGGGRLMRAGSPRLLFGVKIWTANLRTRYKQSKEQGAQTRKGKYLRFVVITSKEPRPF